MPTILKQNHVLNMCSSSYMHTHAKALSGRGEGGDCTRPFPEQVAEHWDPLPPPRTESL